MADRRTHDRPPRRTQETVSPVQGNPTPGAPDASPAAPRAQAPIRWPRPDGRIVAFVALWVAGLALALLVPAALVSPDDRDAPPGEVFTALGFTVAGSLLVFGAGVLLYRRSRETGALVMGLVPAFTLIVGGVIIAATILSEG